MSNRLVNAGRGASGNGSGWSADERCHRNLYLRLGTAHALRRYWFGGSTHAPYPEIACRRYAGRGFTPLRLGGVCIPEFPALVSSSDAADLRCRQKIQIALYDSIDISRRTGLGSATGVDSL